MSLTKKPKLLILATKFFITSLCIFLFRITPLYFLAMSFPHSNWGLIKLITSISILLSAIFQKLL
jgi:hypothetical protein